jgi:hypothetical protein
MAAAVAEPWGLLPAGLFFVGSFFLVVTAQTNSSLKYRVLGRGNAPFRECANVPKEIKYTTLFFKKFLAG